MTNWTDEQGRAIQMCHKNVLIEAGAGSGKPAVIVEHYCEVLGRGKGLEPEHILVLTFTKKAAGELKKRMVERLKKSDISDDQKGRVSVTTIHGFCKTLIDKYGVQAGLVPNMELLEEGVQMQAMQEQAIDETLRVWSRVRKRDIACVLEWINYRRLMDVLKKGLCSQSKMAKAIELTPTWEEYLSEIQAQEGGKGVCDLSKEALKKIRIIADIYGDCKKRMNQCQYRINAYTFDEMILKVKEILGFPEIRRKLQNEVRHIIVD